MGTLDDFSAAVQRWWAQPFNSQGSVGMWFLFFGLVLLIIIAWNTILRFILDGE